MTRAAYDGDPWAEKVKCLVCEVEFTDRDAYREHTRSGWHRENSNRKMMGDSLLSEDEWKKQFGPKETPKTEEIAPQEEKVEEQQVEQVEEQQKEQVQEPVDNRPPPGENEIDVCIIFDYKGERWSKTFRTVKGCTLLDLKRVMVKSESPEEDVYSFDLQKRRVRVNNYDTIDDTETFEFQYIGPEEGSKKKEKDKDLKAQREEQSRQFRLREDMRLKEQGSSLELEEKKEADRKAAEEKKRREEQEAYEKKKREQGKLENKTDAKVDDVEVDPPCDVSGPAIVVYVHHLEADPLKGKTLSVTVPSTCTVLHLRRAICNKIGRKNIADVRLHKKGHTYSQWPLMDDNDLLGTSREFFARGADLIPAAVPLAPEMSMAKNNEAAPQAAAGGGIPPLKKVPGGLDFLVTHDTDDDTIDASLPKGKTVLDLKRAICDRVRRGPYTKITLADAKGNPMADNLALDKIAPEERKTLRMVGLPVCAPFQIDLRVVHATDPSKHVTVSVEDIATVAEIRKEVLKKHKRFKPADLKIVTVAKAGATPSPMPDSMRLQGKKEMQALGPLMDSL